MGRQAEGPVPAWGSLGLTAAMLSSYFLLIQAQKISITLSPPQPVLGENILLTPGGRTDFVLCSWYRGRRAESSLVLTYVPALTPPEEHRGIRYTGRESSGPGCYLRINNLMVNDTEKYMVTKTVPHRLEEGEVYLDVKVVPSGLSCSKGRKRPEKSDVQKCI